jgi:hypothetical protein
MFAIKYPTKENIFFTTEVEFLFCLVWQKSGFDLSFHSNLHSSERTDGKIS